jgi:hypothetical protein
MGTILNSYYDKAAAKGGLNAQIKLAMITKISSSKATDLPDSPENLKIFEDAFAQLD